MAMMHRVRALIPLVLAAAAGCTGGGTGEVTGTLFMRGCAGQGTTAATGMPSPLPAFNLLPTDFYAEPILPQPPDIDPRGVATLTIRLQRSTDLPDNTDYFLLYVVDVVTLQGELGKPQPIIPPALSGTSAPLPTEGDPRVLASINLNGTCPYPLVAPQLTGTVTFGALGLNEGDILEADFSVTVSDPRGVREGVPAQDQDAAGAFSGSFRFPIAFGPSAEAF